MRQWLIAAALLVTAVASAQASETGKAPSFAYATVNQGRQILTNRDDFVQRLSPFDRAARMKTDRDISEEDYLRFVGENVLGWTDAEKALVESALSAIQPPINELSLPWPETIYLIKTTGNEEGGAAYTRGSAIVLPAIELARGTKDALRTILAHELFHVLTRKNPDLKEKLYAAIGFQRCGDLSYPSRLNSIRITNPDAPRNDHCIRLQVAGVPTWVIPILFSKIPKYDPIKGGEFFDYLQFKFLVVGGTGAAAPATVTYDDANIQLVGTDGVSGFFEQVGRNTSYIIHPEEILADNFALLVIGATGVPSPEVLRKMKEILAQGASAETIVPVNRSKTAPAELGR